MYSKLTVAASLIMNSVWGCSASSYFSCWMSMELSLIIFMPLCILGASSYGTLLSVKYLLIQSVAGLLTLGCLIVSVFDSPSGLISVILGLILLVKLGGFPFFHWLVLVGEKLGWLPLYLMLTLQKLLPLFILSHVSSTLIYGLSALSWVVIPILGVLSKTLKKIIILSSLFNLMLIAATLEIASSKWKALLLIYMLMTMPLIALGEMTASSRWMVASPVSKMTKVGLIVFFFTSMGLPPLPSFFMKMDVILSLTVANSVFGPPLLATGAAGMLVLYLGLAVSAALSGPSPLLRFHLSPNPLICFTLIFIASGVLL